MQVGEGQQVQIVQAQPQGQAQPAQSGTGQTMQVMQQIITNTGEIQQIPVRACGFLPLLGRDASLQAALQKFCFIWEMETLVSEPCMSFLGPCKGQ